MGRAVRARVDACYTCRSCDSECPVNIFTGRLHPAELVRMAHYGLVEELLEAPEIWYCLSCNRCSNVCPMNVRPAVLFGYLRREAIRHRMVPSGTADEWVELHRQFHRIRWHVASALLRGDRAPDPLTQWDGLAEKPIQSHFISPIDLGHNLQLYSFREASVSYLGICTEVTACLTCRECSNACPVCFEPSVFDPVLLFRLAVLGLLDIVLSSPSLWLCMGCQSCTKACPEKVKGHLLIRRLQEMALEEGYVDVNFLYQWQRAQGELYRVLLDRVQSLLEEAA
ncbi:MAG: 4Fe-4S dicluster domain-containing protein [Syntrophobacteria bacterium]